MLGRCPTGKRPHYTRKDAKNAAKRHKGGRRPIPYTCDECGLWHIGKPPPALARGEIARDEIRQHRYDRRRVLGEDA
ncbi:hypothetical protein [Dermacoccus nishinomiyaensis]|uniref:hypothetical protein n=1 Tax=Dermacoccus nishinomiyaensis TaxID=1274 RepID=UPI00248ED74A|nr:hypothetical protein [Dermacoccus nishinomiyaensis]